MESNVRLDLPDFDETLRPTWPGMRNGGEEGGWGAGSQLVQIHEHLRVNARELLAAIDELIAGGTDVDGARAIVHDLSSRQGYSAVGSFCSGFCTLLTMHHSIEDRSVFPGLGRVEPQLVPVLRRLMAEHEVIAEIIGLVYEAIDAAEEDRRQAIGLKRIAEHLRDRLFSHLRYEEAQLVPALNAHGF